MISNSKRIEADMSHHVCVNLPIEQLIETILTYLSKVNKSNRDNSTNNKNLQQGGGDLL